MQAQQQITKNGLLPTPSRPKDLPAVQLTENARQVLIRRYVRRGDDGNRLKAWRICSGGWLITLQKWRKTGAVM